MRINELLEAARIAAAKSDLRRDGNRTSVHASERMVSPATVRRA
jgi:hypothetical protein